MPSFEEAWCKTNLNYKAYFSRGVHVYMRYCPGVRSRWLDIDQVLFVRFYPAILTEQARPINYLLYGQNITQKNSAFARTKRAIPSGRDRPILPAWVGNQATGFASSCSLAEPAI